MLGFNTKFDISGDLEQQKNEGKEEKYLVIFKCRFFKSS